MTLSSIFLPNWALNCCRPVWESKLRRAITVTGAAQTNNPSTTFNAHELRRRSTLFPPSTRLATPNVASMDGHTAQFTPLNTSLLHYKITYILNFIFIMQFSNLKRHVAVYHIGTYEVPDEAACPCNFKLILTET